MARTRQQADRSGSTTSPVKLPPLGFTRAGVVTDRRFDVAILAGIVLLLALSRWLAFPASIWDQDEANFALGVLHFDPLHNQPHAPFFPLWIGLGKLAAWALPGLAPGAALGAVGALASIWLLFPLTALSSALLPRRLALASAVLALLLPGPWLLAGRAYTEPTATALLVAVAALWLPPEISRPRLAAGGLVLAATLLVRPQWLPAAAAFALWRVVRARDAVDRALAIALPAVVGAAAVAVVAAGTGGLVPLWAAVEQHRRYIAGAAAGFSWSYPDLALHAVVGGVVAGTLWLVLTLVGGVSLLRDPARRKPAAVVLGLLLAPQALLLLTAQNPTLPRYALPLLALSAAPATAGARTLVRRPGAALASALLALAASIAAIAPTLGRYHREPAPVVAAIGHVAGSPGIRVIAADRRLVAFTTLLQAEGGLHAQLVFDYQVELGAVASGFRPDIAAVAAGDLPPWIAQPARVTRFKCRTPVLRRVASPRFLDLTVVEGCALVQPAEPSIRPEDLRPGALIPAR